MPLVFIQSALVFFGNAHVCRYSQEISNGGLQSIVWQLSRDKGTSWEAAVTISDGREHQSRDGMPGLARLPNGTIVLVFEGFWAHGPGHFSVQMRTSHDDGDTFDSGRVIYATAELKANAGAPQVAFAGGDVWVSFMCDEDTPPALRDWPSDAVTKAMRAVYTPSQPLDFGGGRDRLTIGVGPDAMWPSLPVLGQRVYALYGHRGSVVLAGPLGGSVGRVL